VAQQKEVIIEVSELLDHYCEQCFVNTYFKKEYGKRYAQKFCIKECTVGEKLKEYGRLLS
jgi:hypothetical protein